MPGPDLAIGADGLARCAWCDGHADYVEYHDREWGRPATRDEEWFEKVSLEGFQAGLSWLTVLRKRDRLRHWFLNFDPRQVASLEVDRIEEMLLDPGIIRHRGKVLAVGGVKDKVLAAHRAGVLHVALPEHNMKDLKDLPDEVKEELTFHSLTHVDELLALALDGFEERLPSGSTDG